MRQKLFLLIIGVCAAFIEFLIFREALPVFQGTDIISGFIVADIAAAFWLGVYFYGKQKIFNFSKRNFFIGIFVLCAAFVFSFVVFRSLRAFLGVALGGGISLKSAFLYIFLAVVPVNFMQGALCAASVKFAAGAKNPAKESFIFISLGFAAGAIICSLFLGAFLATDIIIITAILFLLSPLLFAQTKKEACCTVLAVIFAAVAVSGASAKIDKKILEGSFGFWEVKEYKYTPYGQTALVSKNGESALLENGIINYSNPDAEIIDSENFGHIPALYHENPKKVLIIGGAARYLPMILTHKVKQIDYVEPDKAVTDIISSNIYRESKMFDDIKVNIYNENIRQFIKNTPTRYDLILVGFSDPVNLYINGFYTKDFFLKAKKVLAPGGLLAVNLSGKLTFSSYIMAELNKSVARAVGEAFKYSSIIPGARNIIVGGDSKMPYRINVKRRLYEVQQTTLVLSKYYLDDLMDTQATLWFKNEMDIIAKRDVVNSDLSPSAMMLSVLYMQSGFSPYLSVFLDDILQYSYLAVFAVIIIFFLSRTLYKTAAFAQGVSAAWLAFNVIFAFQTYSGQIFRWGACACAVFILGVLVAILFYGKIYKRAPFINKMFLCEALQIALFIVWYIILKIYAVNVWTALAVILCLGVLFGAGVALLTEHTRKLADRKRALVLTLAGFVAASLLGGGFLIPAWGIEGSLYFIFFLKFLIFCRWADLKKTITN
ncbi:hypothetical protein [Endomicrobium proavitum]|uniref:Polyamine aminopropyltransferase n=1 Tax=Endomicrobium proavitum TaxID=1408281 RepID=A0A0G3WKZ7_9BACT|nr:hypothetical protein [Endomicrobium proavitum]AKL98532.1 putative Spermidine synthase [Endomicrobium proavitum]